MKVAICTIAHGLWYGAGAARMMEKFVDVSPGYFVKVWTDSNQHGFVYDGYTYPPGTVQMVENQFDYTPYGAKPRALLYAMRDADVAILLDASFYPIRSIEPLVEHIAKTGYYLCQNGWDIGTWTSDRCLTSFGIDRNKAMTMADCSSYCVGINCNDARAVKLAHTWAKQSTPANICGAHINFMYKTRRTLGLNSGFVSNERRCRGHRHDQSVLSLVAHQLGMLDWVSRPKFTTYKGSETEETVLVCKGMGLGQ